MNDASSDKIRIGMIGLGGIATRMHIPALSSLPEVKIVAGAEINPSQAERTQQRFGIPRVYTNYQEMLDVEQLDAVYVCLPSYLHYEAARAALEKRLHVYCEKPMGISAREARELVEAAVTYQVVLMPGYQLRFNKNYQRGKALIDSRRLGKVLQVQAAIANPGPYAGWDPKSDWYYDSRGCGVLFDLGCHLLDLLMFLCQPEIIRVSATATISLPGLEVPDCVAATFATNTHVVGSLSFGWSAGATFDLIEVHGSSGSLLVSSDSFEHLTPSSGGFDRLANLWYNAEQLGQRKFMSFITGHSASEGVAISRNFIDVLRGKTAAMTNAWDAVRVLEILDAMRQSLASGQSVDVCRFTRMLT